MREKYGNPTGPYNMFACFVGPNPITSFNPISIYPTVHESAFIGPFSTVIGDVVMEENVFIAPNVSIRADEGTPFHIGKNTNIQDGSILHGLKDGRVEVQGIKYSIYIGENVNCTHGCIIHGPCKIEKDSFIGFNSTVLNAIVGEGSYVAQNALVTGGIRISPNSFIPPGAVIDTQEKADSLGKVPKSQEQFSKEVQKVNKEFPAAYETMFGKIKCSCGITCHEETLHNLEK